MTAVGASARFRIRRAGPEDASALAQLGARLFEQSFGAANTREDMEIYLATSFGEDRQRDELAEPTGRIMIAETEAGESIGYAHVRLDTPPPSDVPAASGRYAELVRLYADRLWHGGGLGAALMDACVDAARVWGADRLWLGVWEHNPRAIAFYAKHGFRQVGTHAFTLGTDLQTDQEMVRELGVSTAQPLEPPSR